MKEDRLQRGAASGEQQRYRRASKGSRWAPTGESAWQEAAVGTPSRPFCWILGAAACEGQMVRAELRVVARGGDAASPRLAAVLADEQLCDFLHVCVSMELVEVCMPSRRVNARMRASCVSAEWLFNCSNQPYLESFTHNGMREHA